MKRVGRSLLLILIVGILPVAQIAAQSYIDLVPTKIAVRPFSHQEQRGRLSLSPDAAITGSPYSWNKENSVATSNLPDGGGHSYGVSSALDGSLTTSWSEGASGSGIGERIAVLFDVNVFGSDYLYLFPGWGGSVVSWEKNNRVKDARVTVLGVNEYSATGAMDWTFLRTVEEFDITFRDTFEYQGFPIGRYLLEKSSFAAGINMYVVIIEIQSVYPGTQWDDTCISEILITEGSRDLTWEGP